MPRVLESEMIQSSFLLYRDLLSELYLIIQLQIKLFIVLASVLISQRENSYPATISTSGVWSPPLGATFHPLHCLLSQPIAQLQLEILSFHWKKCLGKCLTRNNLHRLFPVTFYFPCACRWLPRLLHRLLSAWKGFEQSAAPQIFFLSLPDYCILYSFSARVEIKCSSISCSDSDVY